MSYWKDFDVQKPEIGVEVLAFSTKWIDEDFNPRGMRVGFLSEEGFVSAFWWDYQDDYITISKENCDSNKEFFKNHIGNTEPELWIEFPNIERGCCG